MNKKEVNPRLFVTCRLCLDDLGQYQIVPEVKEQISYCFDIQVEPFDGLPQLICKKCEAILSNYSKIKKKFIEKQKDLKDKIQESIGSLSQAPEPIHEICIEKLNNVSTTENLSITRKRKACVSSCSDLECDETPKDNKSNGETDKSWAAGFTRQYVCRICSSRWTNVKSLKNHISVRHSALNKKYSHIFKRNCVVRLPKIDGKPNITGSRNKVMHRREKIVMNANAKYYIIYTTKDYKNTDDEKNKMPCNYDVWNVKTEKKGRSKDYECSDSSEDEIIFKRKRTRRLCSRSSNDTVVLDTANKSNMSDNETYKESQKSRKVQSPIELGECINIDDSSDNESENSKSSQKIKTDKQRFDTNNEDFKPDQAIIDEVIKFCQNKYIKKHYYDNFLSKASKNPSEIALQLKRKILSIGRKIINKKIGVNCTPLLRFIEHKNLDITWLPREIVYVNQDSNYIRIMTRMKTNSEICDDEIGWTDYTPTQTCEQGLASNSSKGVNIAKVSHSDPNNVRNGIDIPEDPSISAPEITLAESVTSLFEDNTRKLLNANPVANPKQLPKKSVLKSAVSNIEVTSQENNDRDFCMPIITSTTSLALQLPLKENNDSISNIPGTTSLKSNDQTSEAPRIKVKPVSELMSVETLSRMQEPIHVPCIISSGTSAQLIPVQNENNVVNIYVPPINVVQLQDNSQQDITMNLIAPEPAWQNEFMILDTIEMPNTRTNSPFLYLKTLLQLHNIVLLDTDVELSKEFNCLIKFKVLYKQDTKNQPVILCLELFCSKNSFCLKVKDRNYDDLNLTKISPNWQWEVLKIYKGEVVSKLLNNAQKIGQDVFEFTKRFLCLLKSINIVKMT